MKKIKDIFLYFLKVNGFFFIIILELKNCIFDIKWWGRVWFSGGV